MYQKLSVSYTELGNSSSGCPTCSQPSVRQETLVARPPYEAPSIRAMVCKYDHYFFPNKFTGILQAANMNEWNAAGGGAAPSTQEMLINRDGSAASSFSVSHPPPAKFKTPHPQQLQPIQSINPTGATTATSSGAMNSRGRQEPQFEGLPPPSPASNFEYL